MTKPTSPPSQPSPGIINAINSHNAGRDAERLAMKYAKMAQNASSGSGRRKGPRAEPNSR